MAINTFYSTITPDKVANISLWFDADDTSNITKDGSNFVSQWNDKSANAYHVTQPTGANQPLWNSSGYGTNSKPYISFNGTSQFLQRVIADIFSGDSSGTMFFVYTRPDLASVGSTSAFITSSDTATTTRTVSLGQLAEVDNTNFVIQNNGGTVDTVKATTTRQNSNNQPMLGMVQSNGTAYNIRTNGIAQSLTATSGSNTGDWFADTTGRDNFGLGAYIRTITQYSYVNLAEVVYYSAVLTANQITQIESYFTKKYGAF